MKDRRLEIYDARYEIRKNEGRIRLALQMRDFNTVGKLQKRNEYLRREILRKYAIIL